MGWETLAIAGYSALNAENTLKTGKAAAKAAVQQGDYQVQQTADQTLRSAGTLKTSFLQSGLSLEGAPMDVLTQAFAKGQTDIGRIATNANATAKNDINSARTKALEGLATSAASAYSFTSFADNFSSGFSDAFSNPATLQTNAIPGFGSYGPFEQTPLPWRQV